MALFWRVFTTFAAVNSLCLAVLFGLASIQYDAVLSGLIRDRLAVVAQNLAEPFQAVANLGLPIETLRNADELVQRTKQSSTDVLGIYLFDPAGNIVRSTEADTTAAIETAARAALADPLGATSFSEDTGAFLVGSLIRTSDGAIAGGVLIEHGDSGRAVQVQALAARLVLISVVILIVSLCVALVVFRLTLLKHIHVFDDLLATYDRFERQAWRGQRPSETQPEPVRNFGIDTGEIFALLEQSEAQYQALNPSRAPALSGESVR